MAEVEMTCSLRDCEKPLLGMVVLLKDNEPEGEIDWSKNYNTYITATEEGLNELVLLHPNCWTRLFDELMAQEGMTALTFIIGGVQDVRVGLEIP